MDIFIMVLIIINIILLILTIYTNIRLKRFQTKNIEFMKMLGNGTNLEDMIKKYIQETNYVNQENAIIKSNIKSMEKDMQKFIQKVGVVRYNAFDDVGSNLSFVIALLDAKDDGIVINGIYARETSTVYAKPVVDGTSEYLLSKEEQEAIQKAKQN